MIQVEQRMNIQDLHNQGHSIREIAQITGHSRNTIRKVLRGQHQGQRQSPSRASKLDPFKDYLTQRFGEHGLSAVRLLAEIRPMGYDGSLPTLRRFLATLKTDLHKRGKLTVRFETPPGQQAQADWAYCGRLPNNQGTPVSVYAFVMVLSYSRMLYLRFTTSMKMASLIDCHQQAFDYFQGWTRSILYDNMKQVKISAHKWNEQFLDFANHYGFVPKTHRPYRPRTKGKVERTVDYVKDNFLKGRSFVDLDDLNGQGQNWLEQTANVRIHGTTGEKPIVLLAQEQPELIPITAVPVYHFLDPVQRKVNWESMVHFQGSCYSVPPEYAGQSVEVAHAGGQIIVRTGDLIIAEHTQAARPGQCIVDKEHLAELWKITEQQIQPPSEVKWQQQDQEAVEQVNLDVFEEVTR